MTSVQHPIKHSRLKKTAKSVSARITRKHKPINAVTRRKYPAHALGVIIGGKAPALPAPVIDIALRDRLFNEIQELQRRQSQCPTIAGKRKLRSLESQLTDLLEQVARAGANV